MEWFPHVSQISLNARFLLFQSRKGQVIQSIKQCHFAHSALGGAGNLVVGGDSINPDSSLGINTAVTCSAIQFPGTEPH